MAIRKIKGAKDINTGELFYFKGHAKATYLSNGESVEDAINSLNENGGDSYCNTQLDDALKTSNTVGGIAANTSVASLKNKSFTELFDALLFPESGAVAGTLPELKIANSNETLEVGSTISNASYSVINSGTSYRYVNNGNAFVSGTYTYTIPTVTTQKSAKAVFGTSTRSTSATSYTITGPSKDSLREGKYLYKSRGNDSDVEPKLVGVTTVELSATSRTITGVYKGGKNGSKNDGVCIKADGQLASSVSGTYGDTLLLSVLTDSASTADHAFNTLGINSVELYVVSGVTYTVKLTATKYNPGSKAFEEDLDLTKKLNNLAVTTSSKTFKDASGTEYAVTSYSINTSEIVTGGKFIVKMLITKN